MKQSIRYGRRLVASGLSGLRSARRAQMDEQRLAEALTQSACASLALAAIGTCAGLLRSYLRGRRGQLTRTAAYGVAGGAIGFCAAFIWKTRDVSDSMARSALKNMRGVRDERWLQRHPINYG